MIHTLTKMTVTEEQAKDIFKYIASIRNCDDVKIFNGRLMMKDICTNLWLSVFLERDNGKYCFIYGNNYVSMLDQIIGFKYLIVGGGTYKIPRSLEEILIEMDLNI